MKTQQGSIFFIPYFDTRENMANGKHNKKELELMVLDPLSSKAIARVLLNGYSIEPGGPLGGAGPMRSFVLLTGSLHDQWAGQKPVLLKHESGLQVYVRVAALPVEKGEIGFFEALDAPRGEPATSIREIA